MIDNITYKHHLKIGDEEINYKL